MEQFVITFDEIRALLVEQQYAESDIEELEKAFEFAKKLHAGQYRVSEEPYIIHPMEVVKILIGLRADKHTLMAGFLHDILEDTETKPEENKERISGGKRGTAKRWCLSSDGSGKYVWKGHEGDWPGYECGSVSDFEEICEAK